MDKVFHSPHTGTSRYTDKGSAKKQVPGGTKMRPSDFLSEMKQMIVEMGMIGGPPESL